MSPSVLCIIVIIVIWRAPFSQRFTYNTLRLHYFSIYRKHPTMPPRATRAVSPAVSENEVDILGSLFTDDSAIPNGKTTKDFARDGFGFDANELLDAPDDEGDDGDEAFIALKQAASFRKASNLKGKTVKKGGGFQAMGSSKRRNFFLESCAYSWFSL